MSSGTKKAIAGLAAGTGIGLVFGLAASVLGDQKVSLDKAFCQVNDGDQYRVQIIDAKDGGVIRKGNFAVDLDAGTCTVKDREFSTTYQIKPGHP